eukprot:2495565-Rhodomonas_salina.1
MAASLGPASMMKSKEKPTDPEPGVTRKAALTNTPPGKKPRRNRERQARLCQCETHSSSSSLRKGTFCFNQVKCKGASASHSRRLHRGYPLGQDNFVIKVSVEGFL